MMENEVSGLIKQLADGVLTLEDVAQRFRQRTWKATLPPQPSNYLEGAFRAMQDPESDIPGSFDEVVAAYDRGELTRAQYRVLAEAVAESIRSQHSGRGTEE